MNAHQRRLHLRSIAQHLGIPWPGFRAEWYRIRALLGRRVRWQREEPERDGWLPVTPRVPVEVGQVAWLWTGAPLVLSEEEAARMFEMIDSPKGPTSELRRLMSDDWRTEDGP